MYSLCATCTLKPLSSAQEKPFSVCVANRPALEADGMVDSYANILYRLFPLITKLAKLVNVSVKFVTFWTQIRIPRTKLHMLPPGHV